MGDCSFAPSASRELLATSEVPASTPASHRCHHSSLVLQHRYLHGNCQQRAPAGPAGFVTAGRAVCCVRGEVGARERGQVEGRGQRADVARNRRSKSWERGGISIGHRHHVIGSYHILPPPSLNLTTMYSYLGSFPQYLRRCLLLTPPLPVPTPPTRVGPLLAFAQSTGFFLRRPSN